MGIVVSILRYLGQVWWKMPGNWKQKKKILSCVATSVRDYAERNPRGGYAAIVTRFGEPEQIAASYLEELDVSDLKKQLSIRKRIICAVVTASIIAVGIWAGVVAHALWKYNNSANGYFERVITEDVTADNYNGGT